MKLFSLQPYSITASPADALLSWSVFTLKSDTSGFIKNQKVLVRRNSETPDAKRGKVSFWILSPKMKKCVCWSDEILRESAYKSYKDPEQHIRYDQLFWKLIGPALKSNQLQRIKSGYVYYEYTGVDLKLSDGSNVIILKNGTKFTIFRYGKLWSVRAMNKRGVIVDVDGFKDVAMRRIFRNSTELPPVANLNADDVQNQIKLDSTPVRIFK